MAGRRQRQGRPSARPVRVGEQVRQAIGEMLMEGALKDARLSKPGQMITVTEVRMTPDLRLGRVLVSVFPDENAEPVQEVFVALQEKKAALKRGIADRLKLRYTPELEFIPDDSMAYGAHIESVLAELGLGRAASAEESSDVSDPEGS